MHKTQLRSFARRIGKTLSKTQDHYIKKYLPQYTLDLEFFDQTSQSYESIVMEVGIGMAEHFINQARLNPQTLFIGIEPYLNGIANALKLAEEFGVKNFYLWADDADQILSKLKQESIDKFYLLFPDPWPKTKQKKRRFASKERLNIIKHILKKGGQFIFASDIDDYSEEVYNGSLSIGFKKIRETPHEGYIQTKFHSKAIVAGRQPKFFTFEKL